MEDRYIKKKTHKAQKKRAELVEAALELFFEKGYEAVSIRMIAEKVDSPVGLFYYYFPSKDVVFDEALQLFFQSYEKRMKEIVDSGEVNTQGVLSRYLLYIKNATTDFREKYMEKMHWSIVGAIRENTLRIMHHYTYEILKMYKEKGYIHTETSLEVAANLIAYGVGGSILYQDDATYAEQEPIIIEEVKRLLKVN